ncbi:DUF4834 family protein [Algibacter sp. 2305UL17-15]|uniref:DUF4834 family protein n=1 Tax=Algibacter sp. 2305UL17-15 TaxID=3231268 RepID=UPI0034580116
MLQEASFVGFFRMILIILLIYFGVKILARLFAPFLMKYVAKKAEQKFGQQFNRPPKEAPKKEGEITIDKIPKQHQSNKDVGDYVDYEEIE